MRQYSIPDKPGQNLSCVTPGQPGGTRGYPGKGTPGVAPVREGPPGEGTLGLSTAHICTQGKVSYWRGGSLVRANRAKETGLLTAKVKPAKRGLATFSRASRRRLMRTIAKTKRERLPLFVTLTYPNVYPHDPLEWKRHLKNFLARLGRRYKRACGVWKLEPQKRGAPHYHLLVWGVSYHELRNFVGEAWYQVVDSGDEKHLRAGTRVEWVRSWGGVLAYASKYLGKLPEPVEDPELWKSVGRYWGVFARGDVPWAEMITAEVSDRQAVQVIRYLRRYGHIPARAYRSLTVICDADFWFSKLSPPS